MTTDELVQMIYDLLSGSDLNECQSVFSNIQTVIKYSDRIRVTDSCGCSLEITVKMLS